MRQLLIGHGMSLPCGMHDWEQGCQMVCFQTKDTNLGKFWRALDWKRFIYFMPIWIILWRFGIFYAHLVHFCRFLVSCTNKNMATLIGKCTSKGCSFLKGVRYKACDYATGTGIYFFRRHKIRLKTALSRPS
jgi:hypothetical protein